jgi:hypothetical protein
MAKFFFCFFCIKPKDNNTGESLLREPPAVFSVMLFQIIQNTGLPELRRCAKLREGEMIAQNLPDFEPVLGSAIFKRPSNAALISLAVISVIFSEALRSSMVILSTLLILNVAD